MIVAVAYTPTEIRDEDSKNIYYTLLWSAIENISSHDISIILTAANTTIATCSCEMMSQSYIMDNAYVDPVTYDNGECFLFCCNTGLCITDT